MSMGKRGICGVLLLVHFFCLSAPGGAFWPTKTRKKTGCSIQLATFILLPIIAAGVFQNERRHIDTERELEALKAQVAAQHYAPYLLATKPSESKKAWLDHLKSAPEEERALLLQNLISALPKGGSVTLRQQLYLDSAKLLPWEARESFLRSLALDPKENSSWARHWASVFEDGTHSEEYAHAVGALYQNYQNAWGAKSPRQNWLHRLEMFMNQTPKLSANLEGGFFRNLSQNYFSGQQKWEREKNLAILAQSSLFNDEAMTALAPVWRNELNRPRERTLRLTLAKLETAMKPFPNVPRPLIELAEETMAVDAFRPLAWPILIGAIHSPGGKEALARVAKAQLDLKPSQRLRESRFWSTLIGHVRTGKIRFSLVEPIVDVYLEHPTSKAQAIGMRLLQQNPQSAKTLSRLLDHAKRKIANGGSFSRATIFSIIDRHIEINEAESGFVELNALYETLREAGYTSPSYWKNSAVAIRHSELARKIADTTRPDFLEAFDEYIQHTNRSQMKIPEFHLRWIEGAAALSPKLQKKIASLSVKNSRYFDLQWYVLEQALERPAGKDNVAQTLLDLFKQHSRVRQNLNSLAPAFKPDSPWRQSALEILAKSRTSDRVGIVYSFIAASRPEIERDPKLISRLFKLLNDDARLYRTPLRNFPNLRDLLTQWGPFLEQKGTIEGKLAHRALTRKYGPNKK